MIKFPSIESFRHVVAHIKRQSDFHGKPLPTVEYEGRVKLHGTNAGIHFNPKSGQLLPQSRERVLGVGPEDNAGFAAWVAENAEHLRTIFELSFDGEEITVYGEWCGGNIQKNVALNQLPKMFVLFGMVYHRENWIDADGAERGVVHPYPYFVGRLPPTKMGIDGSTDIVEIEHNNSLPSMYHIDQVAPVRCVVDFSVPNEIAAFFDEITAKYEEECPWAALWGVHGIGEGLVWTPSSVYNPSQDSARMNFKTKGEKHGNPGTKNKVKVAVEAEKMGDFNSLIEKILPVTRLNQGISWMNENAIKPSKHNTGAYLQWVARDVIKEELDIIKASGFEEKVVMSEVAKVARRFYFANTEE